MSDRKFNVALNEGHTPLAPDEPTFTFRAWDRFMPAVLLYYAELCEAADSSVEHLGGIADVRDSTIAWQEVNGCHTPD